MRPAACYTPHCKRWRCSGCASLSADRCHLPPCASHHSRRRAAAVEVVRSRRRGVHCCPSSRRSSSLSVLEEVRSCSAREGTGRGERGKALPGPHLSRDQHSQARELTQLMRARAEEDFKVFLVDPIVSRSLAQLPSTLITTNEQLPLMKNSCQSPFPRRLARRREELCDWTCMLDAFTREP